MAVYQNFKYFYYKHMLPCFEISKKIPSPPLCDSHFSSDHLNFYNQSST